MKIEAIRLPRPSLSPSSLALAALMLPAAFAAHADFTSKLQVGNWSGGAWADNATKEFRNCGLTLKFNGGTALSVIVPASLVPVLMIADPRLTLQPKQPVSARAKFGAGAELQLGGVAISPTMAQLALPPIPHNYDMIRKAPGFSVILPGLNTTLNIDGVAQVLPQVIDCALRERARLANPPAPAGAVVGKVEAMLAGLAIAERSGIGAYMIFPDDQRPGNFQGAAMVAGYVRAQGPGGPANILTTAYWLGPETGQTIEQARQTQLVRMRQVDPNALIATLPPIPGLANSVGVSSLGNGVYEEIYLVQKPGGGFFQFTTSTPAPGRMTAEAAGVKFRAAIGQVIPYK
jgi:hypothetical protein